MSQFKPTIIDVHTNPNTGQPLPGPHILHVATGAIQLMVFTAETCQGPKAYVGPVYSYYEVVREEMARWSDSEWKARLESGDTPARPSWTSSFLVGAP